ncbi:hypothetical protein ACX80D_05315 [Arthrobacter sp. Sr24]
MQSDPGAGTPHTGDDDEIWRDLVSRIEEANDAFLENRLSDTSDRGVADVDSADPHSADAHDGGDTGSSSSEAGLPVSSATKPTDAEPKTVVDFDPLGVWHSQESPAPTEPAAESRFAATPSGTSDGGADFGPRDYAVDDDDDIDSFVPEELPSLSNSDPAIVMSWVGAAGGPLFLVFSAIFWRHVPTLLVVAVIMAFVAGIGYLLYRLPNHRDHDSGDGAVV